MNSVDFFYISLGAGFLVLVGCAVAVTVQIRRILSDVQSVTEDVAGTASDLAMLKDGVKVAAINFAQGMLEKAKKGGAAKKHGEEEEA